MIAPSVKFRTHLFFDREEVLDAVQKAGKKNLSRSGAILRGSMRKSMVRRKGRSKPGQPPSSHSKSDQHPRGPQLQKFTLFHFDPVNVSVITGPEKLGKSDAPATMEHGGNVTREFPVAKRTVRRTITEKQRAGFRRVMRWKYRNRKPRAVIRKTYFVAARPFALPAFEREKPKLHGLWADSVVAAN